MSQSPESSTMVRRTVHFAGRVQGVGFRYTSVQIAQRHDVAGYVQNLPDGRVKLVIEGEPAQVEAFVDAVSDAMSRYVAERTLESSPATGEFGPPDAADTFGMRY